MPLGIPGYGGGVSGTPLLRARGSSVAKTYSSTLFDAAGLTDSLVVFAQPAHSILVAAYAILDVRFAAVGLTDLRITLGDGGDADGILLQTGNLTSDPAPTSYRSKGAYFDATSGLLLKETATDWTAYATAVGANLSTLTAGQITFYFVTMEW